MTLESCDTVRVTKRYGDTRAYVRVCTCLWRTSVAYMQCLTVSAANRTVATVYFVLCTAGRLFQEVEESGIEGLCPLLLLTLDLIDHHSVAGSLLMLHNAAQCF